MRLNFYDPFGRDLANNLIGFNGFYAQTTQDVYFGEASATYQAGAHALVAGVSYELMESESTDSWSGQNGFTFDCGFNFYLVSVDVTTGQVVNGAHPCFVVDEPLTRDAFTSNFWGAFVQDEITLSPNWRLTLGVRYDSFQREARVASPPTAPEAHLEGEADSISPKAALSYLYDGGQFYFAYGRGFNSNFGPTFEWDGAQYARPENKPSELDSYELGWKGRAFADQLQFETAVFYTEQTNRRQTIPNPDAATDFTVPGSLITYGSLYASRGFEASLRYAPSEETSFTAQYTWLDPEWKDYVVETFSGPVDLSGTTPTGVAENIVFLAAEHRFAPWLRGRATAEFYDDYMVTQDNSISGGGYELLNLGATIEPQSWNGATLDLAITNALDEEYYFLFGGRTDANYATPGPPRQFRATLRARF